MLAVCAHAHTHTQVGTAGQYLSLENTAVLLRTAGCEKYLPGPATGWTRASDTSSAIHTEEVRGRDV